MHTRYDTEKEEKRVNERETRGARKASLIKIDRSSKWLMFDIVNRYIKSILKKCLSYLSFSLSFSHSHILNIFEMRVFNSDAISSTYNMIKKMEFSNLKMKLKSKSKSNHC